MIGYAVLRRERREKAPWVAIGSVFPEREQAERHRDTYERQGENAYPRPRPIDYIVCQVSLTDGNEPVRGSVEHYDPAEPSGTPTH